jgi:hypothetical protein
LMAPVRSFCPARFVRGLLLLAGVIAAATKGSASGWIWLLQPVGVNVHAGSTREAMSWVNPAPPPAPETKFVLTASAELGTAAIGWQFGDRLGVALGTQLGSAGVVSLMKGASDRFLTYLPLMGYTMLRLGEAGDIAQPMLSVRARYGPGIRYNEGPGGGLSVDLCYQWDWWRTTLVLGLRYSDDFFGLSEFDRFFRHTLLAAGLTVGIGRWHPIGRGSGDGSTLRI